MSSKTLRIVKILLRDCLAYWRMFVLLLTPLICLPLPLLIPTSEAACGYALLIMATYWITEALPLPVTAFLPFVLFPLLGIMKGGDVAREYIADTSIVLIGGLMMALAVEKCKLHSRIGLGLLLLCGTKPVGILVGFMLPTWFLSMWLSNTATTGMMIPVAEQVIEQMTAHSQNKKQRRHQSSVQWSSAQRDSVNGDFANGAYQPEILSMKRIETPDDNTVRVNDISVTDGPLGAEDLQSIASSDNDIDNNNITFEETFYTDGAEQPNGSASVAPDTDQSEHSQLDADEEKEITKTLREFAKMLNLSIAYAANIGGTATLTGSPTNLIVAELTNQEYEKYGCDPPLTYFSWLLFGLPHAVLCLMLAFGWLLLVFQGWRIFCCCCPSLRVNLPQNDEGLKKVFREAYDDLGPVTFAEISVSILFVALVILWFARDPGFAPGYASLFKEGYVTDSLPAILISTLLFICPSQPPDWMCFRGIQGRAKRVPALLDWHTVSTKLPWGPIFILGGGFALAKGLEVSGLMTWIGEILNEGLQGLPPWSIVLIVAIFVSFLTEITSNTAVINIVAPLLIEMAYAMQINPLYLVLPAGMAASYAFMLPIATPPNAIVFSYGRLRVVDMAKTGFVLNFLCILVVMLGIHTWGWAMFDLGTYPFETDTYNFTAGTTADNDRCRIN